MVKNRLLSYKVKIKTRKALVPIVNMLNHKTTEKTNWEFIDNELLIYTKPGWKIKKGSEIYIEYQKNASAFKIFKNYGFIDDS